VVVGVGVVVDVVGEDVAGADAAGALQAGPAIRASAAANAVLRAVKVIFILRFLSHRDSRLLCKRRAKSRVPGTSKHPEIATNGDISRLQQSANRPTGT
jgi:hypothetical protein